jgi:hypothetical protein
LTLPCGALTEMDCQRSALKEGQLMAQLMLSKHAPVRISPGKHPRHLGLSLQVRVHGPPFLLAAQLASPAVHAA